MRLLVRAHIPSRSSILGYNVRKPFPRFLARWGQKAHVEELDHPLCQSGIQVHEHVVLRPSASLGHRIGVE